MKKLIAKTVKESPNLIKAYSSQTIMNQFPKDEILKVIENAKQLERGKGIDTLKQIVENYNKKEHPTKPGNFSLVISDTGEKAYQRAILAGKTQLDSLGEIVWNDIELPVVFNKSSKRRCVDLLGILNNKTSVLCELKFASNTYPSNSPIFAAIELLIYYYLIKDNSENLDKEEVFHKNEHVKRFKWSDFNRNSMLIVAANQTYWTCWKKQFEGRKNEIESWHSKLTLEIRFFSFDNFDFKKQKGDQSKYLPSISDKREWTEVYL